jgi:DNA repair protein RecO (recombination protein O)
MAIKKTEAIVLKSIKLGETSKIVTVYSRNSGIIKIIAKGSRSYKSRHWGCLEPLNYILLHYYEKPNRDLHFLSQVDIIQSFGEIRKDLNKTAFALAICEILIKTQYPAEASFVLFKEVTDTFLAINGTKFSPTNNFLGFQLRFIDLAGFNPDLQQCLNCHRIVENEDVYFNSAAGGILCGNCVLHETSVFISARGLRYLNWLRKSSQAEISRYQIPDAILQESEKALLAFMNFHIEGLGKLNALDFMLRIR